MVKFPDRGDVVWLDFIPQSSKEISKTRPAIVISPYEYNTKTGLALFLPITSQVKGYPFEYQISTPKVSGVVLCDQVRSMDYKSRNARKICSIESRDVEEMISLLRLLIELI